MALAPVDSVHARLEAERAVLTRAHRRAELYRLTREEIRIRPVVAPAIPVAPVAIMQEPLQIDLPAIPFTTTFVEGNATALAPSDPCGPLAMADASAACAPHL